MRTRLAFADYIELQVTRTDPVGRFAGWLLARKPRIGGYLQIKHALHDLGADDWVHEALELAFDDYAVAKSRRERELSLSPPTF